MENKRNILWQWDFENGTWTATTFGARPQPIVDLHRPAHHARECECMRCLEARADFE